MGSQKIKERDNSTPHKLRATIRFLKHLHQEIELAQKLEDIQDKVILAKFHEYIKFLEEQLSD